MVSTRDTDAISMAAIASATAQSSVSSIRLRNPTSRGSSWFLSCPAISARSSSRRTRSLASSAARSGAVNGVSAELIAIASPKGLNCPLLPADCGMQPPDSAPAGRLRCASILTDRRAKMTTLQVYDPFADTGFDELFRGFFRPVRTTEKTSPVPVRIDVAETDSGYTVQAEIPGVKKDEIHVAIEGNQVTISAEIKRESETKDGERVLRSERYYGGVYRSFTLPTELDETA